ncbi:MAG: hypothetical protein Q4D62_02335 [Planctomycetia bacterium]|nr:hypothetical protein [Planctomycetia bacterium]
MSLLRSLALSLGLLCLVGCGGGESGTRVSGTVQWKNEPIAKGRIEFVPVDGKTASAGAVIQDGQYSVTMPPGEKVVRLFAYEDVRERTINLGNGQTSTVVDTKQILPPEENVNSTRRVTVSGKKQTLDF